MSSGLLCPLCSAAGGGGVPADAAGGGQPFIPVPGGDLQTALCQEGHRARQPHLALLRPAGHGAGSGHTGQSPGTTARAGTGLGHGAFPSSLSILGNSIQGFPQHPECPAQFLPGLSPAPSVSCPMSFSPAPCQPCPISPSRACPQHPAFPLANSPQCFFRI